MPTSNQKLAIWDTSGAARPDIKVRSDGPATLYLHSMGGNTVTQSIGAGETVVSPSVTDTALVIPRRPADFIFRVRVMTFNRRE